MRVGYVDHGSTHLSGELAWGNDPDVLRLAVIHEGKVRLEHPQLKKTLGPRDVALILGTGPVTYSSTGRTKVVFADVRASDVALSSIPRYAPFTIARGADAAVPAALGALMVDILARDEEQLDPLTRAQLGEVLRSLMSSALMTLVAEAASDWQSSYKRAQVLRIISAQFTDPDLCTGRVAEQLGMSRRALQRLYEGHEHTVAGLIIEMRTQRAIEHLKNPSLQELSLTDIANLTGFGSAQGLRRAITKSTGMTPTALRESVL